VTEWTAVGAEGLTGMELTASDEILDTVGTRHDALASQTGSIAHILVVDDQDCGRV
jgi:hypothetical protein